MGQFAMPNIRESLKDWERVSELVALAPGRTAPEIARLLGKPANSALGLAVRKGRLTRSKRKDRTKRFPNVGSWVYSVKESLS